uniref:Apple domain-containing protein n=1 Tax=Macrostomum lignano TaxID=282301 RepID=A0A1I8F7S9_9PLAT
MADLDETIPCSGYWTVANRDNSTSWRRNGRKKIGEYAMPPSLRCRDRCDSACAAFTDLDSRLTFLILGSKCSPSCLIAWHSYCWATAATKPGQRDPVPAENCPRVTPGSTLSGARLPHARPGPPQSDSRSGRSAACAGACAPLRELYSRLSESDSLLFVLCALLCERNCC